MREYGQFCPIAIGAEVFAERWTPLILRELLAGSSRFNEIERGLPGIPRATLSQRLKQLERLGVVGRESLPRGASRYVMTDAGRELAQVAVALGSWAKQWGYATITEDRLDPDFLLWDMHRSVLIERLPPGRTVMQIDLTGAVTRSYWLVLERDEPSLCVTDPGFPVAVRLVADTAGLHRVWMGEIDWAAALRSGRVVIEGPAALRRSVPFWFALGYFARA